MYIKLICTKKKLEKKTNLNKIYSDCQYEEIKLRVGFFFNSLV